MTKWLKKWTTEEHYDIKVEIFNILDRYINSNPISKIASSKRFLSNFIFIIIKFNATTMPNTNTSIVFPLVSFLT